MGSYNGDNKHDAIGHLIKMGQRYGASVDNNGHTTVTVGKAVKVTPTGQITLQVEFIRKGLWNDEPDHITENLPKTKTFKGMKLFPLNL